MKGQMSLFKSWAYEEDSGTLMAKCPTCEGRMPIHIYAYANPYHYCPYCGEKLEDGAVCKAKDEYGRRDKFANTSDHSFIENGDITGAKVPEKLNKAWYVELAKERLVQYGC